LKRFYQYIADVSSGKEIVGEFIKLAVKRHIADIEKGEFIFDENEAQAIISFAEICRHWKGDKAGETIVLENWQCFYFGSLMGWKKKNGKRRFQRSYLQLSRKNAKTTMLAILSIYHMAIEGESGSQVYCGATKEEQARILINDIGQIINKTPQLRKLFKLFRNGTTYRRVLFLAKESIAAPLGADSDTSDGFDPSMGMIDEYHAHKNDKILDIIESGMGARLEPLLNIITTAGFNKNLPCYAVTRKTGIEILKGIKQDDNYLILIYEIDEGDDWNNKQCWIKSNPNYNVSVNPEYLESRYNKAKNEGGTTEVNFQTKNLNVWTDSESTWIADDIWNSCNFPFDLELLNGASCVGGLDLATKNDLCSFSLIFTGFDPMPVLWWFWLSEHMIEKSNDDNYRNWVKKGHIISTPGDAIDHDFIGVKIIELSQKYNISGISFDQRYAHHGLIKQIRDSVDVHELGQSCNVLGVPTSEADKLIKNRSINHFGNPVMRWMMSNVVMIIDSNANMKPDKNKSADKIDGVAAFINAIAEMMTIENEEIGEVRFI